MKIPKHSYQLKSQRTEELLRDISSENRVKKYLEALQDYSDHTFEHSYKVGLLCVDIGFENNLSKREIRLVGYAGLLHDLGKIQIPKEILNKDSPLNSFERKLINEHARLGLQAVCEFGEDLGMIIVGHHEDQENPYPRIGNERRSVKRNKRNRRKDNNPSIVNLTEILSASDLYDALRSKRAYKLPKNKAETRQIMLNQYTGNKKFIDQLVLR